VSIRCGLFSRVLAGLDLGRRGGCRVGSRFGRHVRPRGCVRGLALPSRALCLKLAGTPTADKPLAGMCDSARCVQATHHACHRPVWADTVAATTTFLGSLGRARTTERVRLQSELDRAQRVLTAIDAAAAVPDPAGRRQPAGQEDQPSWG
jgi:hypothetical protein